MPNNNQSSGTKVYYNNVNVENWKLDKKLYYSNKPNLIILLYLYTRGGDK